MSSPDLTRQLERQRQLLAASYALHTSLDLYELLELILDVAAGSIISADPSLDLTDEVIRRLQTGETGTPGGDR